MLTAQDLIEMRKTVAAATVIQSGAFKKELDDIAAASAALDAKMGVVKTLEQVEARRGEIAAELEAREVLVMKLEQIAQERHAALDESAESAKALSSALDAKADELGQRETVLAQVERKVAADVEASAAVTMKRTAELDERQQRLVDRENKVRADETALKDRIARAAKMVGA